MIHGQENPSLLQTAKLSTGPQKSIFSRKVSQETMAESLPGSKRRSSVEEKSHIHLPKLASKAESMVSLGETKPTKNAEITEVEEEKDSNIFNVVSSKGTLPNLQIQFFDFENGNDFLASEPDGSPEIRIQSILFNLS